MTADRQRKSTAAPQSAKKAQAKKAPAKKSPAKEAPAKKSPAKNSRATKAPSNNAPAGSGRPASAPRAEARPRPSASRVAASAAEQLAALSGKTPEGVTGIERTEDGWRVTLEVLEIRRIPETTDVIAQYEIETDEDGSLTAYRRLRRYTRGSAQED